MSAGFAPPNPGTPRKGNQPPKAPFLHRRGGLAVAGIALSITGYLYFSRPASPRDGPALSLSTPGVKNIEKAYSNAGATPTHTPAYGGTKMGDRDSVALKEGGATGGPKNSMNPMKQDSVGDDQRPGKPTKAGEVWDQTMLGSHKGEFLMRRCRWIADRR